MAGFSHDPRWTRSEAYHDSFLLRSDDALVHAVKASEEHGLPKIAVSDAQGKLLYLLAKSIGAKRILEIGTLGGSVTFTSNTNHMLTCR